MLSIIYLDLSSNNVLKGRFAFAWSKWHLFKSYDGSIPLKVNGVIKNKTPEKKRIIEEQVTCRTSFFPAVEPFFPTFAMAGTWRVLVEVTVVQPREWHPTQDSSDHQDSYIFV